MRTYVPWLKRAGGESPHIHPWYFYLHRLLWFHVGKGPVWTEALLLVLAGVAAIAGFRRRLLGRANPSFVRFIALYTFLCTAFYSLLPYKTPWCLLNFWSTTALLAGVGAAILLRSVRLPMWKPAMTTLLLAGAAHLGWQSWLQNTTYASDQRNPYVYAQTSPDVLRLVSRVKGLADVSPQKSNLLINVLVPDADYWPLPWYLRQLQQIDWSGQQASGPVIIAAASLNARLDEKGTHLMVGYFQFRPQVFLELYVSKELWQEWLAKQPAQNAE
jgi:predicted membrane-bound mannosyltransferase